MSKTASKKEGSGKNNGFFWGFEFDPVKIAQSWQNFFTMGDSGMGERRLLMRAATLNYVHDVVSKGTKLQKDATFTGLKAGADVLVGQKPFFNERETLLWFETMGDALFMLWDPRGAEALRGMAKGLKSWKGSQKADAHSLAKRLEENAKLLEKSESIPSLRGVEDFSKFVRPLGL